MKKNESWMLPDGVEELLPATARDLEHLRREITDLHFHWGYDLVIPPLIEYLESLLTGSGEQLDLQTFKLVDQLTGRMMGVRADMTPQVTRIDSHVLESDDLNRLFYLGSVLRARPDAPGGSRSPLQLGAEIYGHAGVESDIEIIQLMLQTVASTGAPRLFLDLGHVGVYRALVRFADLSKDQERLLFEALQRKSQPDVGALLEQWKLGASINEMFCQLPSLTGGAEVIGRAREALGAAGDEVSKALDCLQQIVEALVKRGLDNQIIVDLSELRGYSYHTGVVFFVYSDDHGTEIARGGRYDEIGAAFGRLRPATGYSTDLKVLVNLFQANRQTSHQSAQKISGIFVSDDPESVWSVVRELRASGERVVTRLAGSNLTAQEVNCDRKLVLNDGDWKVEAV